MKTKTLVMKKFSFLVAGILFLLTSCNYEPGVSEAFTKYRFKDGVTTVSIPGWVIGLASNIADLDKAEREILQSIDRVKVLAIEDNELNERVDLHREFYEQINKKGEYEELLAVHDNDENVTIFGKMDESVISEMVILVGGDDNAMIYLKGEIKPELINNMVDFKEPDKFLSMKF